MTSLLGRLTAIADSPGDTPEARVRHRMFTAMGALMSGGAIFWSALSLAFGLRAAALVPLAYLVLTALNFAWLARSRAFERAAFLQVSASVLLPFVFQASVGGIAASGAAMLWALVAVVGSLTFTSARSMVKWLLVDSVLVVVSGVIDGAVRERFAVPMSEQVHTAFVVANVVMISAIVLALMFYFVDQRERAREALAAAKAELVVLQKEVLEAKKLGQYTLIGKLGTGAMGTVYRAKHAMMRRQTAVKVVRTDTADEATLARFEREVQLTATLTHPNVVTIYDYGRTEEGTFYYVMEYLEGADLGAIVQADGPLSPARVVHVLAQIVDALVEAHDKALIHRDIKPANVLLTNCYAPDVVKVVDFGLVKDVAATDASVSTAQGIVAGTPAYMSPEAISHPDRVGPWSDVYSVGCLAYYLLTGVEVFAASTAMEAYSHQLLTAPTPPSTRSSREVPAALESLLMRCLKKESSERPGTADLREALRGLEREPWARWDAGEAAKWWATVGVTIGPSTPLGDDSVDRLVPRANGSTVRPNAARRAAGTTSSVVATVQQVREKA